MSVVVRLETRLVSLLTPVTQTAWVPTLSARADQICLTGSWRATSSPRRAAARAGHEGEDERASEGDRSGRSESWVGPDWAERADSVDGSDGSSGANSGSERKCCGRTERRQPVGGPRDDESKWATDRVEQALLPDVSVQAVRLLLPDAHERAQHERAREDRDPGRVHAVEARPAGGGVGRCCRCRRRLWRAFGRGREGREDDARRDEDDGDDLGRPVAPALEDVVGRHRHGEPARAEDDVQRHGDLRARVAHEVSARRAGQAGGVGGTHVEAERVVVEPADALRGAPPARGPRSAPERAQDEPDDKSKAENARKRGRPGRASA